MVTMLLLRLFIGAAVLGQLYLIIRYLLWPRIQRIRHCPWCWREAGIECDFPAPWSSTICTYHDRQLRAQSRARRRLARQLPATTPTKPAAPRLQAEEVRV
jgi:hypothetical protein